MLSMRLYPWVVPPAVQDNGDPGPDKIFILPLRPPRAAATASHPVSYSIPLGVIILHTVTPTDSTTTASKFQVPGAEGAGTTPHRQASAQPVPNGCLQSPFV